MLKSGVLKVIAPFFRLYNLKRGHWRIDQYLFRGLKGISLGKDIFGNIYLLDLRNCIDRLLYVFGYFEKQNILNMIEAAKRLKPDAFIDIGANIGIYTLSIARKTDVPMLHAFEPDADNNLKLRTNIYINGFASRVSVHDEALSDEDGVADLLVARSSDYLNMGKSSLTAQAGVEYDKTSITVVRLDTVADFSGKTLLMKIDIEGHEARAIAGMERILRGNSVLLQVEIFKENYEQVSKMLGGFGYRLAGSQPGSAHDYCFTNIEAI